MAEQPQLIAGRYEVQGLLDEGGMGEIYRAYDRNLDCQVVVKMPRPAALAEPGFAERFAREIRSLVVLAHPHVVRILDVGRHAERPYAVMPFLGGGNLRTRGLPTSPAALREWLEPIALALDFVHQRGFLHRDVKPPNILFDEHGHPFLSDFGIAKVLTSGPEKKAGTTLTETGNVIGTAAYLAPELIMGKPSDGRADQYALAMTVYEVLCGRVAFQGATPAAVMVQQTVAKMPKLRSFAPELPEGLTEAVHKALKKDPQKRFDDCATFARAVLLSIGDSSPGRPAAPRTGKSAAPPLRTQAISAPSRTQQRKTEVEKAGETPVPAPPPSKTRQVAAPRVEGPILEEVERVQPKRSKRRLLLVCAFVALALVGIGAGGLAALLAPKPDPETPEKQPPPVKPRETIAFAPLADATVRAGESTKLAVTIRREGWSGPVTLSCDTLPPGVTAEPITLDEASSEGAIVLKTTDAAMVGSVSAQVRAEFGDKKVPTPFTLKVLAASRLTLTADKKEQTLYRGDEQTTVGFTVSRQETGKQPIRLHLNDDARPEGITAELSTEELLPDATRFELKLRAGPKASDASFTLTVRAVLPDGNARAKAEVRIRLEGPPVKVGTAEVKPEGEQFHVRVPVAVNDFRAEVKALVTPPTGLELADKPRVNAGHAVFSLRRQIGAVRQAAATVRLLVQAGSVALPVVKIPIEIKSDIIAGLTGPAKPRHLLFTADGKSLLAAGEDRFTVWATGSWDRPSRSKPGKVLVEPSGLWALLRRPGEWDVWTMTDGVREPVKLGEKKDRRVEDSRHVISGNGRRLAVLATITEMVEQRDDTIRKGGVGVVKKVPKTTREVRVFDSANWGVPTTYADATADIQLAGVSADGELVIEGKPKNWRAVRPFRGQVLYPLQGDEYEEVILSPDDSYLACRSPEGQVMVLQASNGKRIFATPDLGQRLTVRFVPGRKLLAITSRDGVTSLWDVVKGSKILELKPAAVGPLVLTPSGVAYDEQRIWLLDTEKGLTVNVGRILEVTRDGGRMVAAKGGLVSVIDLKTRKYVLPQKSIQTHRGEVVAAALAPNGRHLATVDESGLVQVVEIPAGKVQ